MKHRIQIQVGLAICWAVQTVFLLERILSGHTPVSHLTQTVLPEWQSLLRPEWEVLIYRAFIVAAVLGTILSFKIIERIASPLRLLIAEALLTAFLLGAGFKATVYANHPQLAQGFMIWLLVAAAALKVCWLYVDQGIEGLIAWIKIDRNAINASWIIAVIMPVMIFWLIDVPNISGTVARFFVGEQFHHNDSFIYGPTWAFLSGCRLDWDIISQYGVGVGAIFGLLSRAWGSFSYEIGLQMMVWAVIAYDVLWFYVMRSWIKSTTLAVAAFFLVLKFQMFNAGVFPFAFTYGSATVLRNWFDILVMIGMLGHLRQGSMKWLLLASIGCGVQFFYIPSDGAYLWVMFAAYISYVIFQQGNRQRLIQASLLILPFALMLLLMILTNGPVVLKAEYWANIREFVAYFLNGFGLTPIYSGLQDRQFLASLMGFVFPSVYVLSLLVLGTLLFLRKVERDVVFPILIAIYGLCLYHYYVARSGPSSYDVVSVPFVMLVIFWIGCWRKGLLVHHQRWVGMIAVIVSAGMLIFNQNFLAYPNRFNLSTNPLTDTRVAQPLPNGLPYFNHLYRDYNENLKVATNSLGSPDEALIQERDFISDDQLALYYLIESDFSVDAKMIDRLTAPNEPVPLISSFEIKMLMDAKRRPYFYYFPLTISHPLHSRTLLRSSIYTTVQLNKTIAKLDQDRPKYIFVERILLTRPLTEVFYYYYSSMLYLVDHVLQHYTVVDQGKYLVALALTPTESKSP